MFIIPLLISVVLTPDPSAIEQWVRKLDSSRLVERDWAEQRLRESGADIEAILPGTRELIEEYSVEVQHRLGNLRRHFQRFRLQNKLEQIDFAIMDPCWKSNPERLFLGLCVNWSALSIDETNRIRLIRIHFPLESFSGRLTVAQEKAGDMSALTSVDMKPIQSLGLLEVPIARGQKSITLPLILQPVVSDQQREIVEPSIDSLLFSGECSFLVATQPQEFVFPLADWIELDQRTESAVLGQNEVTVQIRSVDRIDQKSMSVQVRLEFANPHDALLSYRDWLDDNQAFLRNRSGERIGNCISSRSVERTENSFESVYLLDVSGTRVSENNVSQDNVSERSESARIPIEQWDFVYQTPTNIEEVRQLFLTQRISDTIFGDPNLDNSIRLQ